MLDWLPIIVDCKDDVSKLANSIASVGLFSLHSVTKVGETALKIGLAL